MRFYELSKNTKPIYEARGTYTNGKPLPPHVSVRFEQAFGLALWLLSVLECRQLNGEKWRVLSNLKKEEYYMNMIRNRI